SLPPSPVTAPDLAIDPLPPSGFQTEPDAFGVYQIYNEMPSHLSDEDLAPDYRCDAPNFDVYHNQPPSELSPPPLLKPVHYGLFKNVSTYLLAWWFYDGRNKSVAGFQQLITEVLLSPDFELEDLKGFSTSRELQALRDWSTAGEADKSKSK